MSTTRFKVCCVRNVAEAELALAHGAAAIGLVSRMPSGPGVVGEAAIAEVARAMAGRIETFLLTAERPAERIADQVKRLQPSVVQLVDAPPDEIARLRAVAPEVSIVSVVHILGPEAVEAGAELGRVSEALLRDSGNPVLAVKELGGTGRTHNWATSTEIVEAADVPVWLAGGLNPENVADAIERVRPHGVDICSGLRPDPATQALDPRLLQRFAQTVHG